MKNAWLDALAKMSYGIYVLTSYYGDIINGMIASWVSQISFDPLLIMVAIHPNRYSHHLIEQSGFFALHMLGKDQKDYLSRFKGPDPGSKFSSIKWKKGKTGCPVLSDCAAYVECRMITSLEPGNHTLFVGEVVEAQVISDAVPLSTLDYEGRYVGNM